MVRSDLIGVLKNLRDALAVAKPCRLALLVVLAVSFIFVAVDQASEVLRCLGEGPAHTGGVRRWRFILCVSGLVALSLSAWYFCRILLCFQFADSPQNTKTVQKVRLWLPRLIGIVPSFGLGLAFIHSASPYNQPGSPAKKILIGYGVVCFLIGILLVAFFLARRAVVHKGVAPAAGINNVTALPRSTRIVLWCAAFVSTILFLLFLFVPVATAQFVGSSAVILLAAASWIVFGSFVIYMGHRFAFSVIIPLLILVALFSIVNDNHGIRYLKPSRPASTVTLSSYYTNWYISMAGRYTNEAQHAIIVVAAAGGGIRAAYFTAIVLGQLQDANPAFADHVFAISGVSGGSLGATVFDSLLKSGTGENFRNNAQQILSQDFLSPVIAYMLFPDLVQRFLPVPIEYFDRARALELSWEAGWKHAMGNTNFSQDFDWLWRRDSHYLVPALFLNGTSVEQGNRMILSNVRIDSDAFLDSLDVRSNLAHSIRLSTAADMSARFTYVSPAGRFENGQHIVDGGYFENSGAATCSDILDTIRDVNRAMSNAGPVIVIIISNDPNELMARSRAEKASEFLHDTLSPVHTLLKTREARGIYSEKDVRSREDIRVYSFHLANNGTPLPLGWSLSQSAMNDMNNQLDSKEQASRVRDISDLLSKH